MQICVEKKTDSEVKAFVVHSFSSRGKEMMPQ